MKRDVQAHEFSRRLYTGGRNVRCRPKQPPSLDTVQESPEYLPSPPPYVPTQEMIQISPPRPITAYDQIAEIERYTNWQLAQLSETPPRGLADDDVIDRTPYLMDMGPGYFNRGMQPGLADVGLGWTSPKTPSPPRPQPTM